MLKNSSDATIDMSKREIEEHHIQSFHQSMVYRLMPLLRKGIFHRTSIDGYKGIRQTGCILPNKGDFPFSYPQSKVYYGYAMSYVCLFDFESAREEDYRGNHHIWANFFYDHKPLTIILRLNRLMLANKLIPNSVRPKPGEAGYKSAIAYVETWYPEAIPVSAIDGYIVTCLDPQNHELLFQEYSREQATEFENLISQVKKLT